ncbi:MAG: (Fe-S)-binding protein [Nanoarchaeota archaeon]
MGLFSIFRKSNVLYYPGCHTFFKNKEHFDIYQKVFSRLGIDFRLIDKKICCGLPALEAGYDAEARKIARRNFEILKEEQITSIITNSPCCYKMFLYDYPEILPDWNIQPKNIWIMMLIKLENNPGLIKNKADESVCFQDSCYLGRYCEIYGEPRKILELIGYDVKEMFNSKSESMCCGSCGGLPITNPSLADEIAKEKLLQAKRTGVKKIIVCSLEEYELLKKNSPGTGIEVLELGEAIAIALGVHARKEQEDTGEEKEEEIEVSEVTENE